MVPSSKPGVLSEEKEVLELGPTASKSEDCTHHSEGWQNLHKGHATVKDIVTLHAKLDIIIKGQAELLRLHEKSLSSQGQVQNVGGNAAISAMPSLLDSLHPRGNRNSNKPGMQAVAEQEAFAEKAVGDTKSAKDQSDDTAAENEISEAMGVASSILDAPDADLSISGERDIDEVACGSTCVVSSAPTPQRGSGTSLQRIFFENVRSQRKSHLSDLRKLTRSGSKRFTILGFSSASQSTTRLQTFVGSDIFSFGVTALVVLNAISTGVEANIAMESQLGNSLPQYSSAWINGINVAFAVAFLLELALRIMAQRINFFTNEEWQWNVFEMVLVLISFAEILLESIAYAAPHAATLRVVRVFRVCRTMRLARLARFFADLRRMLGAICSCIGTLGWALVLLLLINYLFAIFTAFAALPEDAGTFPAAPAQLDSGRADCEVPQSEKPNPHLANLYRAMYALLMASIGGIDWSEFTDALAVESEMFKVAFLAYIMSVALCVLNVITGVFVAEASNFMDVDLLILGEKQSQQCFMQGVLDLMIAHDLFENGSCSKTMLQTGLQSGLFMELFEAYDIEPTQMRWNSMTDSEGQVDVELLLTEMLSFRKNAKTAQLNRVEDTLESLQFAIDDVKTMMTPITIT